MRDNPRVSPCVWQMLGLMITGHPAVHALAGNSQTPWLPHDSLEAPQAAWWALQGHPDTTCSSVLLWPGLPWGHRTKSCVLHVALSISFSASSQFQNHSFLPPNHKTPFHRELGQGSECWLLWQTSSVALPGRCPLEQAVWIRSSTEIT